MVMNHNKKPKKTFFITLEAANLLSVSLRTAQLWVENGLLLLANPAVANLILLQIPLQPSTADLVKQQPEQTNLDVRP